MNINTICDDYNSKNYAALSKELGATDKRIEFEKWLNSNVSKEAMRADLAWHSKVVSLLCAKTGADRTESTKDRQLEDRLIARLISRADPLNLRKPSAGMTANHISEIYASIALANLPSTIHVLLSRQLQQQDINTILQAVKENNLSLIKAIAQNDPPRFSRLLTVQNKEGWTPVKIAAHLGHTALLRFMLEKAPDAVARAMTIQDNEGWTPLHSIADNNNLEILHFLEIVDPKAFKKALLIQDSDGWTPLHTAASNGNIEILDLMAACAPQALTILNNEGDSVLSILKKLRPLNYRQITQRVTDDLEGMEFYKAWLARKFLGHAFHLSGSSILAKSQTPQASITLTGHQSPQWFHLMKKHLEEFRNHYPDLISDDLMILMKQVFDLGANPNSYTLQDKVGRIKAGLPVVLNTGFEGHAVNILIWGDQFVLCDRGGSSRRPIEVYHFDPNNIDETLLRKIDEVRNGTEYEKLFFETLPAQLNFSQTKLDRKLESSSPFPWQMVGNCSFVSPITAVYALLLLGFVRGIDETGELKRPKKTRGVDEQIKQVLLAYRLWIANEQMHALEANIRPLEKGKPLYEPDHAHIIEALRKAHMLPLDDYCRMRLASLTDIYLNSLDSKEKAAEVRADLAFWSTLVKIPLINLFLSPRIAV